MKKILVAVDFSDASRIAAEYAASLAKVYSADLLLLHVYYIPTPIGDAPGYIPLSMTEVQDENEALLEQEIEYLVDQYQVKVDGYVKMGLAAGIIKDMASELKADLLVLGMKGAGKTASIFGSTATACIRKTKLPVLIIPENVKFSSIKNITLAADFTFKTGVECFKMLRNIAEQFKADIQIVHVQMKNGEQMDINEVAGKIRTDLIFSKIKHSFHTIENDNIESGINNFTNEYSTDLLVMVAHHHNLFERLFSSVHTNLIAYQTELPLLVLHD